MKDNKKAGVSGFLVLFALGNLVLGQRFNALGAHVLTHQGFPFTHQHLLNIGVEFATGSTHRKAALVAKLRFFTTNFTHGHRRCCLDFAESGCEMLP